MMVEKKIAAGLAEGINLKDLKQVKSIYTPMGKEDRHGFAEAAIVLAAARLEQPYNPARMTEIVRDSGRATQLGGMYATLTGPNGEAYARNAIIWSAQDARRSGIELTGRAAEIARGGLGTYNI